MLCVDKRESQLQVGRTAHTSGEERESSFIHTNGKPMICPSDKIVGNIGRGKAVPFNEESNANFDSESKICPYMLFDI